MIENSDNTVYTQVCRYQTTNNFCKKTIKIVYFCLYKFIILIKIIYKLLQIVNIHIFFSDICLSTILVFFYEDKTLFFQLFKKNYSKSIGISCGNLSISSRLPSLMISYSLNNTNEFLDHTCFVDLLQNTLGNVSIDKITTFYCSYNNK